ncbi:hypothetical protein EI427_08530 [Flammeovirga pectinis]|uniref:D-alanyl-D-alanine carboxypeptidase-like core domain-containing protein n=1 Tax=Flammeovirga pectinis TaxID=2494373 RepID=A0A3S9P268_9BACT|nr:D-alanyl-D-alanine carboxypeptidase family protein [Flammeovirga pectinis]AZQ62281.1 hypothetical protein EI427_08530 [Flammeovirga pectinis]
MQKLFCIVFLLLSNITLAQDDCSASLQKKYWRYRINMSTFLAQESGIDIHPDKIFYDFMNMPIGVPFNYIDFIDISNQKYVNIGSDKLLYPAYIEYKKMKADASKKGVNINIRSSYRSKRTQEIVFRKHGPKVAEIPGYSEHHLLTTIDIRYAGENTKLFLWLLKYGFDYGWVPTYYFRIEKNIRKEAWHWRFVGIEAAKWFECAWKDDINQEIRRLSYQFGSI